MNHQLRGWIFCFSCLVFIVDSRFFPVFRWFFLGCAIFCWFCAYVHLGEGLTVKKMREEIDREYERRNKAKKKGDDER